MSNKDKASWPSFSEFAENVKVSGAVNRVHAGFSGDMKSYSVYLDGAMAEKLPASVREQEFRDVTLEALTEKLGLKAESFRDVLRVGELVAVRQAWMQGTVEAMQDTQRYALSEKDRENINEDYGQLLNGMDHPWLQDQLLDQQGLSRNLGQWLQEVEPQHGKAITARVPDEVTRGHIVSQNAEFTLQSMASGEMVTHENRRLSQLPEVGKDVTVTYYRGSGQVFENDRNLSVGAPYVDAKTQDLAVQISDKAGELKQVVLFKGVAAFSKFVEEQGLSASLMEQAIEARVASPKVATQPARLERQTLTGIYVDPQTQGFALDYKEGDVRNSVVFGSAKTMEAQAKAYGIEPAQVAQAYALESAQKERGVKPTLEANQVEARGPSATMDKARKHAEQVFGNNEAGKQEFLRRVEAQVKGSDQQAEQKKESGRDDIER